MPRRVRLPGASELFRPTADAAGAPPAPDAAEPQAQPDAAASTAGPDAPDEPDGLRPTGRVRHDEKITVYVSRDELLALEQLRLTLRAEHGLSADRGRIVRAAIAEALADVRARGSASALVRRLSG